ncbi:MAG: multiple sugar transport system substrate-binding protein [Paraglaciecola sp.]|jgi:multiple sugar transport system substrate-binding protein
MPSMPAASAQQRLSVAVLTADEKQIAAFSDIFNQFEKRYPDVQIQLDFYSDLSYKKKIADWLEQGKYNLMYWQAGQRLKRLVEQDLLQPVGSLIDKSLLKKNIQASALAQVTIDDEIQALPFAHYAWGFYYNKLLFKSLDLQTPQNWQEFIALCHSLKQRGVIPLVQATAENWPVLGWIDYLTLDAGGIEFREKFATLGPVNKPLIDKVVLQFSELLGHNFFYAPNHNWKWQQAITVLLRKHAAMSFIGQFAEGTINQDMNDQIGYFPFPHKRYENKQVNLEVSPLDVWIVPQASDKKELLATLLRFLQEPEHASTLAINLNRLPVSNTTMSIDRLNERLQTSLTKLKESEKLVQFFDRDAQPEFSDNLAKGIAKAILLDDAAPLNGALLGETYIPSNELYVDSSNSNESIHISSLTGSKGTFLASQIMKIIYKELGFSLSVNRFSTLEASLGSYKYGSDGELVRAAFFEDIAADLIRIPEPLITSSIYLVCKNRSLCENKLPGDSNIAISSEMLVVNNWLEKNKLVAKKYKSTSAMIQDYKSNQISLMVLAMSDLYDNSLDLKVGNYRTIIKVPFYHYVHKKHADLVKPISDKLAEFKKHPEYQSLQSRYWIR